MHSIHIWDLYQIKFHSCFFCWLTPFGATWKLTECSKYSLYKDPTYTGKRACLMPFFVNALFCSKIRRYDCHVFIPEMIPNYAWSPLHLFFVTRTSLGLIWDKCGWRTVGLYLKYYLNNVCFKKTWTNYSTVSLLCFVQVFLKQTLSRFYLHLLVLPFVYQFNSRIGVLVHSSFAND